MNNHHHNHIKLRERLQNGNLYSKQTNTIFLKIVIPPDQNENLDLSNDNPIQSLSCAK